jgi:hypothetical protein
VTDFAAGLKDMIRRMIDEAMPFSQKTVAAVGTDNTVSLLYGSGVIESVPCAASYSTRTAGDKVWVARSRAGNYEVLAKSEAAPPEVAVTHAELDEVPIITLDWGTTPPSLPWLEVVTMYVKSSGSGNRDFFAVLGAPALPPD